MRGPGTDLDHRPRGLTAPAWGILPAKQLGQLPVGAEVAALTLLSGKALT